ncbi:energy transducer TonB [Sulfurimonas sp. HSL3-7]|uniref:energy transducer TonB n=1 Tax=Sulfonitrofixus jiaomeiensis TaxID=3131938 RepID=UPI0031F8EE96
MTKSFLYSLFLHLTIVLLVIALVWVSKSEENPHHEKRCKIMLSQVCACVPEETEAQPPVVKKQKKPQPKKKSVEKEHKKSAPSPVVEEKAAVVDETPPEMTEAEEETPEEPVEAEPEMIEMAEADDGQEDELLIVSPPPASSSVAEVQEVSLEDAYIQEHINEIMALLKKNLYYPRIARKRGIEGKVLVRFELLANGDIENITVLETEREILARAAVTTIERLEGKFPLPKEMLTLSVPIVYRLH